MATIGATVLTLADWAKRLDADGKIPDIVELLGQTNEVLTDMLFKEGNLPTGERTVIRTGLPTVYWRLLNKGVPNSKSKTAQVDEQCGMLEARCQVDQDLAELNGNVAQFRLSEAQAFLESMNQEMASTLFYGSAANPEEFVGFAPRYSDIGSGSPANSQNIIDAGGTGSDNTSIYLVGWGQNTVHGIFPKGSKAGLVHEDLGIGDAFDGDSNRFRAYMDHWKWKAGLVVKDWRYVVRICNVDVSNLVAGSSAANLIDLMIKAIHRIPSLGMCKPVFYANRTVREMLDIQAKDKSNVYLNVGEEEGRPKSSIRGIPIRTCDAILETEARVV